MSITRNMYGKVNKVIGFVKRRTFVNSLMAILTLFMFFGVMNVYAQEDYKIAPNFEGGKQFFNEISGADADEDNVTSSGGLHLINNAWIAASVLGGPEISEYGAVIENNPNIPYDLKRGVIGLTEDAGDYVYAAYPTVNVAEHLAQQWVPGYAQESTSLYAATHDSGYDVLLGSGIVGLWNRVLNLAYVAFVLIMIVAGFMIMFRHKLGGQTMVTIGNVLPGVITALILATFSFAIAGFIIDIGGVLTGLVSFILGGNGFEPTSIAGWGRIINSAMGLGSLDFTFDFGKGSLGLAAIGKGLALLFVNVGWMAPVAGTVLGLGVVGLILFVVVLGIVAFGALKVLIALYKAYFSLLLSVILGPLQITLGAIPGNSHMIKNWFLSIFRNVLVFPVILFIVNIPNAIQASDSEVLLSFPGKLVNEDPNTYNPDGLNITGALFIFILKIFVLYFAAQAPKFLEAFFPPNSPKAVGEGVAAAKASLSKVPLIGGLFK